MALLLLSLNFGAINCSAFILKAVIDDKLCYRRIYCAMLDDQTVFCMHFAGALFCLGQLMFQFSGSVHYIHIL